MSAGHGDGAEGGGSALVVGAADDASGAATDTAGRGSGGAAMDAGGGGDVIDGDEAHAAGRMAPRATTRRHREIPMTAPVPRRRRDRSANLSGWRPSANVGGGDLGRDQARPPANARNVLWYVSTIAGDLA